MIDFILGFVCGLCVIPAGCIILAIILSAQSGDE